MTVDPKVALRLCFLTRIVRKECKHLATTDRRLFGTPLTIDQVSQLEEDADLAERVDAFVAALLGAADKMCAEIERRGWV